MTKPLSARQAPARLCTVDTTGRWELQRYLGPSVRHLVLLDRMLYNDDLKISSREADRCWAMYFIKIHCTGPPGTDAWSRPYSTSIQGTAVTITRARVEVGET